MSSRIGNLMIAVGILALVMGLIAFPAALGEHVDTSLLTLGACGVSVGSMIAAAGLYFKSRAVLASGGAASSQGETKQSSRRVRGGCDVCHGDSPVIHCKVHQVHMCAECLVRHYDLRSCTYVPSPRGVTARSAKALAKAQSV